jgi:hypothetical protein
MTLPRHTNYPKFNCTLPSLQQSIHFRPYNVGEEKVLLLAFESGDDLMAAKAIADIVKTCVEEDIDITKLATFDIEYMFLQIRSKSVGETSTILLRCDCEHPNSIDIDVSTININKKDFPNTKIKLNDEMELTMGFPRYSEAIQKENILKGESYTEILYHLSLMCLHSLHTDSDSFMFKDEPEEEVKEFMDSLSTSHYQKILEYVNDLPSLKYEAEFVCNKCDKENKYTLQGLQDFF